MTVTEYDLKDSGERQNFDSGAQRDTQAGKPRFDLVPSKALERVAQVYYKGAEKYDENNWMKGMPLSRFLASLERHLHAFKQGETDEDHLAQVVWNGLAILHFQEYPEFYSQYYDLPDFTAATLEEALHLESEKPKVEVVFDPSKPTVRVVNPGAPELVERYDNLTDRGRERAEEPL